MMLIMCYRLFSLVRGSSYLFGQRFCECFGLKFALQRTYVGREKGGNPNGKTKHTEPLTQEIPSALYMGRVKVSGGYCSLKLSETL